MILRYSRFSPFARKVRVCILELGVKLDIQLVESNPNEDESLRLVNPLCKVPTLILDNGEALFDSPVICEYLASKVGDRALLPERSSDPWDVYRDQALGDGLAEAAILMYRETLRPDAQQSANVISRQNKAIDAALDFLERKEGLATRVDIGVIAIACAIGHINLRLPQLNWTKTRPSLGEWYSEFEARESMVSTRPR